MPDNKRALRQQLTNLRRSIALLPKSLAEPLVLRASQIERMLVAQSDLHEAPPKPQLANRRSSKPDEMRSRGKLYVGRRR
jgi:hypothetical protein